MSYAKGTIILAVLALSALSQQVSAGQSIWKICDDLKKTIDSKTWNEDSALIERAKLLQSVTWPGSDRQTFKDVVRAMEAVYNAEECSDKSIDYLLTLKQCISIRVRFSQSIRDYKNKCLSPKLVGPMVKSAVNGRTVSILSSDSIKGKDDELKDWPDWGATSIFEGMKKLTVLDAIHKGFLKERRTSEDITSYSKPAPTLLLTYLNERLFEPCARYVESVGPFMERIRTAAGVVNGDIMSQVEKIHGGFTDMVEPLGKEEKDAIFRYLCCDSVIEHKQAVFQYLEGRPTTQY